MGAGRGRLIRQMLTEGVTLSCCGAFLGIVLATGGTRILSRLEAINIPLLQNVRTDATALAFTYIWFSLDQRGLLQIPQREPGAMIVANNGSVLAEEGAFFGDAAKINQLPDYVPNAVIAIEDRRFRLHHGIDPIGLAWPRRIASTPAMNVVATAPMPGSKTPSFPLAGRISAFFVIGLIAADSKQALGHRQVSDFINLMW